MTLKPHERRQNQTGPLRKKKPGRVPNGLSLDLNHNNHQHHHSDQENNPRLAHTHSKKKKKHLQKKHRPLKPGQNNCKDSDSESVSGESKPSIRSSSRDRPTDRSAEAVFTLRPAGSVMCLCSAGDKNILFTQLAASVETQAEAQLCLYTVEVETTGSSCGSSVSLTQALFRPQALAPAVQM
ncbi:autism susceptibility gene 2 protein-like [Carassius auratus]|uniref:Autism susceptibility gene 2 protein-like n=1 Tax=Carassius auratus TaxID=7957 RepID=A0A6P6N2W3_CARAU|nr:autism susceptibility gene 2 protein-like [Carassius auratus]